MVINEAAAASSPLHSHTKQHVYQYTLRLLSTLLSSCKAESVSIYAVTDVISAAIPVKCAVASGALASTACSGSEEEEL